MINEYICEKYGDDGYAFSVCCKGWENRKKIIVYSFGIGEDLSFSLHLLKKWKQCEVYAFDPTPKSISFIDCYDKTFLKNFYFYPIGLSNKDNMVNFYLPKNSEFVSGSEINNPFIDIDNAVSVQMHTLNYIMNMLGHDSIDLLKMDIEGSEFLVIPYILENGLSKNIQQICVEVHNRFYDDGNIMLKNMFNLLEKNGYKIINISKNKEEMTFIKIK